MRTVAFTLARPLPLIANNRMHWRAKGKLRDALAVEIMAATAGAVA